MNNEPTWAGVDDRLPPLQPGLIGWLRIFVKGVFLVVVVFGGLLLHLTLRLIEWPLFGASRPWTPFLTQSVCRASLFIIGLGYQSHGTPMVHEGAVVSNHASWLDIFVLNASDRVYFVAKSEVAAWPGIGWLARATGTVFIRRDVRDAADQKAMFETRLMAGHKLLFFPEGTSTDGRRVVPFKPTLFAAFFSEALRDRMWVQPVSVVYAAPEGGSETFYGWWGDMDFGGHLVRLLAAPRHGRVDVYWHMPLAVADFRNRKALAKEAENAVRSAFGDTV